MPPKYGNRYLALVAIVATVCGCGSAVDPAPSSAPAADTRTAAAEPDPPLVIVAMGNSLTEGYNVSPEDSYPAQLERKLRAAGHNVRVINAGISGETSSGARARVGWVLTLKPHVVILETGGNDGLRGIDPKLTAQNIEHIVKAFQAQGVKVLLAGMQIVQNMGQQYVDEFQAIYPDLAARRDVTLIPFFLAGVAGHPDLNQSDGIHPTAEGYAIVAETVYPFLVRILRPATPRNG